MDVFAQTGTGTPPVGTGTLKILYRTIKYNFRYKRFGQAVCVVNGEATRSNEVEIVVEKEKSFNTGLHIGEWKAMGTCKVSLAVNATSQEYKVHSAGLSQWTGSGNNAVNKLAQSKAGMEYKIHQNDGSNVTGWPKDTYAAEKAPPHNADPGKSIDGGSTLNVMAKSSEIVTQCAVILGGQGDISAEGNWDFEVGAGDFSIKVGAGHKQDQPVTDDNAAFRMSVDWKIRIICDIKRQKSNDGGATWQDDVPPPGSTAPPSGSTEVPADEVDKIYPGAIAL